MKNNFMMNSLNFFKNKKILSYSLLGFTGLTAMMTIRGRMASSQTKPNIHPDGEKKKMKTKMLEMGTSLMQSKAPMKDFSTYMVGFHPMQHDSCHQMEAHHYCKQVNEDFAQCILFDSNTSDANLVGLEYIISEKLYNGLSKEEKHSWHPHNYEILSGQLMLPGVPFMAEKMLMKQKMNSYGKTFHTWRAKCWEGDKPFIDTLPIGDAILAWSFNHDGEVKKDMVEERDKTMKVDTERTRKLRQYLVKEANAQNGVNYIAHKFRGPTKAVQGVVDKGEIIPNPNWK